MEGSKRGGIGQPQHGFSVGVNVLQRVCKILPRHAGGSLRVSAVMTGPAARDLDAQGD